ncbi:hypothetical protein ASD8599_03796 [Ascidiaceihabitans donghaensis]|uniref:Uncharacterized protein n=2 Tax=Ascidiaceihabitans donghaensis TaxID=1510460 RepID=A0A2R8BP67_9RHOB|nr:hypothetical protein ASD8599_03796 [Ascidiaceihabitans donghaensis]
MKATSAAIEKCLTDAKREDHSPQFVRTMLDEIFENGYFVHSMEVHEIQNVDEWHPRIDWGIYGLDHGWDTLAKFDAAYARQIVDQRLGMAMECENQTICHIWLDDLVKS